MKKARLWVGVIALLVQMVFISSGVRAAEPEIKVSDEELEKGVKDDEGLERHGKFGPLSFFGYGELHYNNPIDTGNDEIDFHRLVLGVGYDFNDWIQFKSELDFEHAFKDPELEFAYLNFLIKPWLNVRAGALLVPMGVINQHHEPPLFYSVERPEFYRVIIPTTWQEGGAGLHGELPAGFDYELYVLSMPNAKGFTGSNGIRGGRGHVGNEVAHDFGGAGRFQYKGLPGLRLGTSVLFGNTGQNDGSIDGGFLSMFETDAKYSFQGIDLEGALALTNLADAGKINASLVTGTPTFTNFVGRQMLGWYLEGAYHLLHHFLPSAKQDLILFGRYEKFNTQFKMPSGFAANPANDRQTVTTGLSYLPIPQVAVKADYMFNRNEANSARDQFNLGVGFYY